MRKFHIVGNWKMNQLSSDIDTFFSEFNLTQAKVETWIAPQAMHIPNLLSKNSIIKVGAQNCCENNSGAFTGELSPIGIKDAGASFVLIGHSERRSIYKEDHALLNKKTKAALAAGLTVIFCVGEQLEDRENGSTEAVLKDQIDNGLKDIELNEKVIVAYEPVWAIGTGKTATPEQAQDAHKFIREYIGKQDLIILYGGSMKPENIEGLISQDDVDGGLIGGASLKGDSYKKMVEIANNMMN